MSKHDFANLEQMIFAAGRYVVPSENHRPATLEAARDACDERRYTRHAGLAALTFVASWVLCWPIAPAFHSWQEKIAAPSSADIERSLLESAPPIHGSRDWRLVEVFDRWHGLTRGSNHDGSSATK